MTDGIGTLCVYCGSNAGTGFDYVGAARGLGRRIAEEGLRLVYGGARVGCMGAVADGALEAGGTVIGVLPEALRARELAHPGLSELHIVGSMHERKSLMADLSDGFVALPGGAGTLEEIFEMWTWAQLGHHAKPCAFLNVNGFYGALVGFLDQLVTTGFVRPAHRDMLIVADEPESLIAACRRYAPPQVAKWIGREER